MSFPRVRFEVENLKKKAIGKRTQIIYFIPFDLREPVDLSSFHWKDLAYCLTNARPLLISPPLPNIPFETATQELWDTLEDEDRTAPLFPHHPFTPRSQEPKRPLWKLNLTLRRESH